MVRVATKFCISDFFFHCTVSIFFAIFSSFIYFIVFVEEGWVRDGSKVLAMIVCWALKWLRSLLLVVCISRDKTWGRDGIGDRWGKRGSECEQDLDSEGLQVLLLNINR